MEVHVREGYGPTRCKVFSLQVCCAVTSKLKLKLSQECLYVVSTALRLSILPRNLWSVSNDFLRYMWRVENVDICAVEQA